MENKENSIFHYCGIQSFMSIITTGNIWLTDLYQTNDAKEGAEITDAVCLALRSYGTDEHIITQWREHFLLGEKFSQGFGFCMSEEKDLLSQWRGYADHGEGFSVGFDREKIRNIVRGLNPDSPNVYFACEPLAYNENEQVRLVHDIACKLPELIEQGATRYLRIPTILGKKSDEEKKKEEIAWKQLMMGDMLLSHIIRYRVKNSAFAEEKEWRIYAALGIERKMGGVNIEKHTELSDVFTKINYTKRGDRIIPYYEFEFKKREILTEIIIGPKNKTPDHVVELFLIKNEYKDIKINKSNVPFL